MDEVSPIAEARNSSSNDATSWIALDFSADYGLYLERPFSVVVLEDWMRFRGSTSYD
jgi:hypothetical protein